jgi:hypothetical protein
VVEAGASARILLGRRSVGRRIDAGRNTQRRPPWPSVHGLQAAKEDQQRDAGAQQQMEEAQADALVEAETSEQRTGEPANVPSDGRERTGTITGATA